MQFDLFRSVALLQSATPARSRRAFLQWGLFACASQITSPIRATPAFADGQTAPQATGNWLPVAPDIYFCPGVNEEVSADNAGVVVNSAVLLNGRRALLIDPGPHWRRGVMLRQSLQQQLGAQVVAVVNTHAHPENVLGNAAFADLPIYASAETTRLMKSRCKICRQHLGEIVGAQFMRETPLVFPSRLLRDGQNWRWGRHDLKVAVFSQAHSPSDLSLFEPASGVLFAGGLSYRERIPEMQEASLAGWIAALQRLQHWPTRFVIGNGTGTPADTLEPTLRYLLALREQVSAAINQGEAVTTFLNQPPNGEWQGWRAYPERHALNVQRAWTELENFWWNAKAGRAP